jgi:uncharacterized protein YjbI with pentapeptide repeats
MDPSRASEVWSRLVSGRPLDDLGLPVVGGRVDLRGLAAPEPSTVRQYTTPTANVKELGNLVVIQGARWTNLDFTKGQLKSLRLHDSKIENCCFDGAKCSDWRIWGTSISNTSFKTADLRKAALGGVDGVRRNAFYRVDFTKADLRQTVNKSADFVDCTFSDSKLVKVDFQGSVFVNCAFSGDLVEVSFHRTAFGGEKLPPNEMLNVDFANARLRSVEFRGLDLDTVTLPDDNEHIIVHDYARTLDHALVALKERSDMGSKQLAAYLGVYRKWAGRSQKKGVFHRGDLIKASSEEAVAEFLRIVEISV